MKLENILLDSNGNCKLSNFNNSFTFIEDSETHRYHTKQTEYCSPERNNFEQSTDYWSLGVLIYTMLIGDFPYLNKEILRENIYQVEIENLAISKEAKELITSLLKRNTIERLGYYKNNNLSIKSCLFFTDIDWNKLEKLEIELPFKPIIVKYLISYLISYYENFFVFVEIKYGYISF